MIEQRWVPLFSWRRGWDLVYMSVGYFLPVTRGFCHGYIFHNDIIIRLSSENLMHLTRPGVFAAPVVLDHILEEKRFCL